MTWKAGCVTSLVFLFCSLYAMPGWAQVIPAPPNFSVVRYGSLISNLYHGEVVVADFDELRIIDIMPGGLGGQLDRMDVVLTGLRAPRALDPANDLPVSEFYLHETEITNEPRMINLVYNLASGGLRNVFYSSIAASDFDNDTDIDLVLTGATQSGGSFSPVTQLYRNDRVNGRVRFTEVEANFVGVYYGSAEWGDYDRDARPDLLLTGLSEDGFTTRLYRNLGDDRFEEVPTNLPDLGYSDATWGDYDNDGDLDLLLSGSIGPGQFLSVVYRNDDGVFVEAGVTLPGLGFSETAWFDYDSDGRLDILLSGGFFNPFIMQGQTVVYRNLGGGAFAEVPVEGDGHFDGDLAIGDYDNDGDPDFVVGGRSQATGRYFTRFYRNDGDAFRLDYSVPQVVNAAFTFADVDRDNQLDLFITGFNPDAAGQPLPMTQYYINDSSINAPPSVPTGLEVTTQEEGVLLSWEAATDDRTPPDGLTYAIRIGRTPGSSDMLSARADLDTGKRHQSVPGNAGSGTSLLLKLPPGGYYWSIQAVDAAYAGSAFTEEQFFGTGDPNDRTPPAPPQHLVTQAGDAQVLIRWDPNTEPDLAQYRIYRGTTPGATTLLATLPSSVTTYADTSAVLDVTYYYRLTAIDATGNESDFSEEVPATPRRIFMPVPLTLFNTQTDAEWGDFDNDGDLDLVIASGTNNPVLRNEASTFVGQGFGGFSGVYNGMVTWGDYDSDGDLDLSIAGRRGPFGSPITRFYTNEDGSFHTAFGGSAVPGVQNGVLDWDDYDNDGDADLLLTGNTIFGDTTIVYRNEGDVLVNVEESLPPEEGLPALSGGTGAWGDYNNDSYPDILLTGNGVAQVIRNDIDVLVDAEVGLPGLSNAASAWGDYDNDGDLDVVITGRNVTTGNPFTRIYKNEGGQFTVVPSALPNVTGGAVAWGDYDNDGDLDLLLSGNAVAGPLISDDGPVTRLYINEQGQFIDAGITPIQVAESKARWGDYDNDGDLDLLLFGHERSGFAGRLYRNDFGVANTPPSAPTNLSATVSDGQVTLQWQSANDNQTPSPGLTYNLRIGSSPGSVDVLSPNADPETGFRRLAAFGNAYHNTTWRSTLLEAGTYFWSVQAIDTGLMGSPFAVEGSFVVGSSKNDAGTAAEANSVPERYHLEAGYPNPFRERTTLRYGLAASGSVRVVVYDVRGRLVRVLLDRWVEAGEHEMGWDGRDGGGVRLSSGLYFCRLEVGGGPTFTETVLLVH